MSGLLMSEKETMMQFTGLIGHSAWSASVFKVSRSFSKSKFQLLITTHPVNIFHRCDGHCVSMFHIRKHLIVQEGQIRERLASLANMERHLASCTPKRPCALHGLAGPGA